MNCRKKSNFGDKMTIQELLDKCEIAYMEDDFKKLIELCDEVFEIDPDCQIAIGYKSGAYCFLNQHEKALEILKKGIKLYPDNYYLKNNIAMVYYDLGDYEKSLKYCEQGLKIKGFDWLYNNKIKALLKLERIDEAMECYENGPLSIDICDLLIETGKYSEALKFCLEHDLDYFKSVIDEIKEKNTEEVGDYYISWIYKIKSKSDIRFCPDCGGELIPIVWGLPHPEFLKEAENDEIFLGGCCIPPNPPNYHCKKCGHEFDLGVEGLHIECDDYHLYEYIEYKIRELVRLVKEKSFVVIQSLDTLKKELKGYDDEEFNAFIKHLIELDFLYDPCDGYVKLVGYDDFGCAKEYLDEGKYPAPVWLAFPQLSPWTMGWKMIVAEDYAINLQHLSKEYHELFPMPKYWQFSFSENPYKPYPPIGYFWNRDGKTKYQNTSEGIEVNDFITLEDEKEFDSGNFSFKSIEHAEALSKALYFERYPGKDEDLDVLEEFEFSPEEEKTWDIYRYSVLLNAGYFKIMQDDELKQKLLETGDEPLIYICDDEENLFGRALMEIRDEIRRICKNEDLIDWEYTEYLKYKPWG